jgi:hypothetical protein
MRQIKPTDTYASITREFLSSHGDTFENRKSDARWRQIGKLAAANRL